MLHLAFLTWTRLHGIIGLELGGHLGFEFSPATGIGAAVFFDAEVRTIRVQAMDLPVMGPNY